MIRLVLTSIQREFTPQLTKLVAEANQHACNVILVQDTKSGDLSSAATEVGFMVLPIATQVADSFAFAHFSRQLPTGAYSRKNLGYLIAWEEGADWVAETDDDNVPSPQFFTVPATPFNHVISGRRWVNPYRVYTEVDVWPRGLPLRELEHRAHIDLYEASDPVDVAVVQAVADSDPDVDAIFRLTRPLPIHFNSGPAVAMGHGVLAPMNSQATWWRRDAARLMYFPSTMSWRAADIWRGVIAQIILQSQGLYSGYVGPFVRQDRNAHDLLVDFAEEIPCYLHTEHVAEVAHAVIAATPDASIEDLLTLVYQALADDGTVGPHELQLLAGWHGACTRAGLT